MCWVKHCAKCILVHQKNQEPEIKPRFGKGLHGCLEDPGYSRPLSLSLSLSEFFFCLYEWNKEPHSHGGGGFCNRKIEQPAHESHQTYHRQIARAVKFPISKDTASATRKKTRTWLGINLVSTGGHFFFIIPHQNEGKKMKRKKSPA